LRQACGLGVNGASAKAPRGSAAAAANPAPPHKNCRRFMRSSPLLSYLHSFATASFSQAPR
jgi:hypothetical protein